MFQKKVHDVCKAFVSSDMKRGQQSRKTRPLINFNF